MKIDKEYIPSWHIEDQEWWQKYSAMVNSQQIQVEKTATQVVDFTTPIGSGSISSSYTGSGSGSLGIRYVGSGSGSGSLGIRYVGSGSGSGSLGIRYVESGSDLRNRYVGIAPGSKIFKYIGSGKAGSNAKKEKNILAYGLGLL